VTPLGRRRLLQSGVAAALLAVSGMPARARSRGGKLTAALSGASSSDSWDGRTHAGPFMMAAAQGAVFDTLTEVAADGSLKGELAVSWDASPDARVWTFDLRPEVQFHDGTPFTAEDVVASFRLHTAADSPSPVKSLVKDIVGIEKSSTYQVRFELAHGNADFPYLMSDYHLLIYPADNIGDAIAHGIGTGLYQVDTFIPGERFIGRRVADHYKGDSAGFFDEIEFIAMNDASRRVASLMMGKVDAINAIPPASVARLEASPAVELQVVQGNRHLAITLRYLGDPDIRSAIKHGIDRAALVNDLMSGFGVVASDSPIGPANPFYASDIVPDPFDPDRAKFHLARAGLTHTQIGFDPRDGNEAQAYARALQTGLASADFESEVVENPTADWNVSTWNGRATEHWALSSSYDTAAVMTDRSEAFDTLLLAARSELDGELRREMYYDIQMMLRDHSAAVIPAFSPYLQATSNRIGTPSSIGNLWDMDSARMAERWWSA